MRRQRVDDRTARIAESQQFRDLIERLAGRVVARLAEQAIGKAFAHFEQVRMPAADYQRQRRVHHRVARFEYHGVYVSFNMIDRDERDPAREADRFRVRDADQQRSNKPRTLRYRDG